MKGNSGDASAGVGGSQVGKGSHIGKGSKGHSGKVSKGGKGSWLGPGDVAAGVGGHQAFAGEVAASPLAMAGCADAVSIVRLSHIMHMLYICMNVAVSFCGCNVV